MTQLGQYTFSKHQTANKLPENLYCSSTCMRLRYMWRWHVIFLIVLFRFSIFPLQLSYFHFYVQLLSFFCGVLISFSNHYDQGSCCVDGLFLDFCCRGCELLAVVDEVDNSYKVAGIDEADELYVGSHPSADTKCKRRANNDVRRCTTRIYISSKSNAQKHMCM